MVQVNITFNKIRLGFCPLFVFSIEFVIMGDKYPYSVIMERLIKS